MNPVWPPSRAGHRLCWLRDGLRAGVQLQQKMQFRGPGGETARWTFRDGLPHGWEYLFMTNLLRQSSWFLCSLLFTALACAPATDTSDLQETSSAGGAPTSTVAGRGGGGVTGIDVFARDRCEGGAMGDPEIADDRSLWGTKSCNTASITCSRLPPCCATDVGQLPWLPEVSVDGHCYTGACVPMEQCRCASDADCPYYRELVCYTDGHCGELVM